MPFSYRWQQFLMYALGYPCSYCMRARLIVAVSALITYLLLSL